LQGNFGDNTEIPMTACADGSFCCGFNSNDCCEQSQGLFIIEGRIYNHTNYSAALALANPDDQTTKTTSNILLVAISLGLGVPIILACFAAVAWYIWNRGKKKREEEQKKEETQRRQEQRRSEKGKQPAITTPLTMTSGHGRTESSRGTPLTPLPPSPRDYQPPQDGGWYGRPRAMATLEDVNVIRV
jgi:cbb3-type cytochrome oxidase subunit 3